MTTDGISIQRQAKCSRSGARRQVLAELLEIRETHVVVAAFMPRIGQLGEGRRLERFVAKTVNDLLGGGFKEVANSALIDARPAGDLAGAPLFLGQYMNGHEALPSLPDRYRPAPPRARVSHQSSGGHNDHKG